MLSEPIPLITSEMHADWYAEIYPGFPRFVHLIMAHCDMGKTPEEAADLVRTDDIKGQVDSLMTEIKRTTATWGEDGDVVLPESIQVAVSETEISNILTPMIELDLNRDYTA
jgi:hypothetical protein